MTLRSDKIFDLKGGRKEKVFGCKVFRGAQKERMCIKFLGFKENLKNEEEKIDIFL